MVTFLANISNCILRCTWAVLLWTLSLPFKIHSNNSAIQNLNVISTLSWLVSSRVHNHNSYHSWEVQKTLKKIKKNTKQLEAPKALYCLKLCLSVTSSKMPTVSTKTRLTNNNCVHIPLNLRSETWIFLSTRQWGNQVRRVTNTTCRNKPTQHAPTIREYETNYEYYYMISRE